MNHHFKAIRCLVASVLVLSLTAPFAFSQQAEAPQKTLAIVFGSSVPSQIVARVVDFINVELSVKLDVKPVLTNTYSGFEKLTHSLSRDMNPNRRLCLLAVVAPSWDSKQQGAVYEPMHIGILNINALTVLSDDEVPFTRQEQFERRVEKESLRAMALLCGLKPCPFPQCCLYEHRNEQELDRKSRNPCPPCHSKAMDALRNALVPVADRKKIPASE